MISIKNSLNFHLINTDFIASSAYLVIVYIMQRTLNCCIIRDGIYLAIEKTEGTII